MFVTAINATGSAPTGSPWAFCQYLKTEDERRAGPPGTALPHGILILLPFNNAAALSYKPENIVRGPLSVRTPGAPANTSAFTGESLDWDIGAEAALRPSGKLSVMLHYAGRGVPRPIDDYSE